MYFLRDLSGHRLGNTYLKSASWSRNNKGIHSTECGFACSCQCCSHLGFLMLFFFLAPYLWVPPSSMMPLFLLIVPHPPRHAGFLQYKGGFFAFWPISRATVICTRFCPINDLRAFNFHHPYFPKPCLVFKIGAFHECLVLGLLCMKSLFAKANVRSASPQTSRHRNPPPNLNNSIAFYRSLQLFAFSSHSNLLVLHFGYFGVFTWGPVVSCVGVACFTGSGVQQSRP